MSAIGLFEQRQRRLGLVAIDAEVMVGIADHHARELAARLAQTRQRGQVGRVRLQHVGDANGLVEQPRHHSLRGDPVGVDHADVLSPNDLPGGEILADKEAGQLQQTLGVGADVGQDCGVGQRLGFAAQRIAIALDEDVADLFGAGGGTIVRREDGDLVLRSFLLPGLRLMQHERRLHIVGEARQGRGCEENVHPGLVLM